MKKDSKIFDCIVCLLFVIIYAIFKNNLILMAFFTITILKEILYIIKKDFIAIINNIFLMIPLMGLLNLNRMPFLNIYIAIFTIFYIFSKNEKRISLSMFVLCMIFFIFDLIKFSFFNSNINNIFSYMNVVILYLAILASTIAYRYLDNKKNIKEFSCSFVNGTFLSLLFGFISRWKANGILFAFVNNSILTRNSGASGDPNYFGLYICISISLLIVNNIIDSKSSLKDLLAIALFGFLGLTTSSRMYIIILLMLVIVILMLYIKKIFSKNLVRTITIVAIFAIVYIYLSPFIKNNLSYIFKRLDDADITNGRSTLIKEYTEYINEDLLKIVCGIGIPQYNIRSGIDHYAHNYYIELYVTQGILGIAILAIFLIINIKKKKIIIKLKQSLPLLIFLIGGLGINYIEVEGFYILLALLISNLSYKEEKNE